MHQSPMLRSQSSMRLPKCEGVHSTVSLASIIGWRISSQRMNHSSTTRKISFVPQRQQCG